MPRMRRRTMQKIGDDLIQNTWERLGSGMQQAYMQKDINRVWALFGVAIDLYLRLPEQTRPKLIFLVRLLPEKLRDEFTDLQLEGINARYPEAKGGKLR
jgi:hypothetical protein